MGSGWRKRAELARLEVELSAVKREQTRATGRTDPRWLRVAWALLVWSVLGPVAGYLVGFWVAR